MRTDLQNNLRRLSEGAGPLLRAIALGAAIPSLALAEDRFPDHRWGVDLLVLLEAGPALLDPDTPLGLAPPPGPALTRSELDRLQLLSARLRDAETRARIRLEAEADPRGLLLSEGLIPPPGAAPALWALLGRVAEEATFFALREKRRFARPRPSTQRPGFETVIADPPHPAYPSGHATQIHTITGVLSGLRPGCAEAYRLFAAGVALRREVAGVHYPSDTRAGELIAGTLVPLLLAHPDLSGPLRGAEREMRRWSEGGACRPNGGRK